MADLDLNDCLTLLFQSLEGSQPYIVTVDGASGAGKSYLAEDLGKQTKCECLHLDDYYLEGKGSYYFRALDFGRIRGDIEAAGDAGVSLIVEGVLVLEILEEINIAADGHIYVRRVSAETNTWEDKWFCDPGYQELEDALKRIEALGGDDYAGGVLDRELAEYHHKYNPLEKADCIFDREV